MTLDFNYSKVAEPPEGGWFITADGEEHLNPLTQAIVFATMAVDMGSITALNYDEFFARINLIESVGSPFYMESVPTPEGGTKWLKGLTKAHIACHIGLTTNVVTRSRTSWAKSAVFGRNSQFPTKDPTIRS